jgi:hypothetical protein
VPAKKLLKHLARKQLGQAFKKDINAVPALQPLLPKCRIGSKYNANMLPGLHLFYYLQKNLHIATSCVEPTAVLTIYGQNTPYFTDYSHHWWLNYAAVDHVV